MEKSGLNKQQRCFATLLKSQPRMDASPENSQHTSREHFWGTISLCQISFERLDLKKVII